MQSEPRAIRRGNAVRTVEPTFNRIGLPEWKPGKLITRKGASRADKAKYFKK